MKTSRRDFLKHSALLAGTSVIPIGVWPFSSRRAHAQTPPNFDYYISPNGSDANPGTLAQPWAITAINTKQSLYAGKRVGLLDGTYDLTAFAPTAYSTKLTVAPGTASSPTIVSSVNPRAAILYCDQSSPSYVMASAIGNGANGVGTTMTPQYITLQNLTITGGIGGVSFAGRSPKSCNGLVITGCHIYNMVNPSGAMNIGCIDLGTGPNNTLIDNCWLHDCYVNGMPRNQHNNASGVHDYANGTTVQYCTIHDCNNLIYQKNQNATPPPDGLVVRYNYLRYGTYGCGPAIAGMNNAFGTTPPYTPASIHNNVFENVSGIYYNANDGVSGLQSNLSFFSNTVYSTTSSNLGMWILTSAAVAAGVQVKVYNNILVRSVIDSARGDLALGPAAGDWQVCDYNCYSSAPRMSLCIDDTTYPSTLLSFAQWQALTGSPDQHSLISAPNFVGPISAGGGTAQYRLAANSPCLNSGRSDGTTNGSTCDMGAWGNGVTYLGCDFAGGSGLSGSTPTTPMAPTLLKVA